MLVFKGKDVIINSALLPAACWENGEDVHWDGNAGGYALQEHGMYFVLFVLKGARQYAGR